MTLPVYVRNLILAGKTQVSHLESPRRTMNTPIALWKIIERVPLPGNEDLLRIQKFVPDRASLDAEDRPSGPVHELFYKHPTTNK